MTKKQQSLCWSSSKCFQQGLGTMYSDYLAVICDVICNTSEKSSTRTWGSYSFIAEAEHDGDPVPFGYKT